MGQTSQISCWTFEQERTSNLLRCYDSIHEYAPFQVFTYTHSHRNDVQSRHSIDNGARWWLSVNFPGLRVRIYNILHKLSEGRLETSVMLKEKDSGLVDEIAELVDIHPYSKDS